MKQNGIWIDLENIEQVRWWNKIGHKLVRVAAYNTLVEADTNKPVGYVVILKGLFKNYVIKKNNAFITEPKVRAIIDVEV